MHHLFQKWGDDILWMRFGVNRIRLSLSVDRVLGWGYRVSQRVFFFQFWSLLGTMLNYDLCSTATSSKLRGDSWELAVGWPYGHEDDVVNDTQFLKTSLDPLKRPNERLWMEGPIDWESMIALTSGPSPRTCRYPLTE